MYFTKEDQTLYVNSFEFNTALVINELNKIVSDHGGRVKPKRTGFIECRAITTGLIEFKNRLEKLEEAETKNPGRNEKRTEAIKEIKKQIARYESIDRTPQKVTGTYTAFTLDGYYYYFEFNSNPFFEHHHIKTEIINGKRSRDAYLEEIDRNIFLHDCLLRVDCSNDDIKEIANLIFNALIISKPCDKHIETHRKRVSNLYDNGYHYETIKTPERFEAIEF